MVILFGGKTANSMYMSGVELVQSSDGHLYNLTANVMVSDKKEGESALSYWNPRRAWNAIKYKVTGGLYPVGSMDEAVPGVWYRIIKRYSDGSVRSESIVPYANVKTPYPIGQE
jgi:hypothetical protein